MPSAENEIYTFDDFRLDVGEKTLRKGEVALSITPMVFETLYLFVRSSGHLIEKNQLMLELWGDRIVEETNLTFNIKMLRKALGDDAQNPRFLETVPKRGYRFIADVRRVEQNGSNGVERPLTASRSEISPRSSAAIADQSREPIVNRIEEPGIDAFPIRRKSKYLVLAAAAVVSIGVVYFLFYADSSTPGIGGKKTIAVLPIRPIDSTTRDEDYEIGIADSLINRINSLEGIFARPLSSTRKYTDLAQDSMAAGREQKVDYVIASTYQLADGKMRITAQLLNIASGTSEDTYVAEKNASDIFALQDEIADELGNRLMTHFSASPGRPAAKRGTNNEEAYRLYLQGMYLYDRRTLEDAENALDKLERATQLDPSYAKAWAGKAHVHRSLGYFSVKRSTHDEYANSIDAINRALSLDENLSDAHSALCENKFFYEYDFAGAERECKRAIALDPNSFLAHEIYSRCLWTLNRFDDAIKEVELSIDLQPTSLFSQRNYGISLFYARRGNDAIQQFRRVSEVDPNFVANYAWFIPALLSEGKQEEAFRWFIKWQTLLGLDDSTIRSYEKAYQETGWQGIGRVRVGHIEESKVRSYFLEACLTAHTGNTEKTFEYLERSLHRREWGIPFLQIDPSLDGIRSDPRFESIVERVKPMEAPSSSMQNKKPTQINERALLNIIPAATYFPTTESCSIIGSSRLNFRVRDGNGCDPTDTTTGKLSDINSDT